MKLKIIKNKENGNKLNVLYEMHAMDYGNVYLFERFLKTFVKNLHGNKWLAGHAIYSSLENR